MGDEPGQWSQASPGGAKLLRKKDKGLLEFEPLVSGIGDEVGETNLWLEAFSNIDFIFDGVAYFSL